MTKVTFKTLDTTLLIPSEALATYRSKHNAVERMMELGGIYATDTQEVRKLMSRIRNASQKIKRNGWHSTTVAKIQQS
jgi:hypothetical protein